MATTGHNTTNTSTSTAIDDATDRSDDVQESDIVEHRSKVPRRDIWTDESDDTNQVLYKATSSL